MADDFTVNLNTTVGEVFASDEVSGKHYPFTKIAYGADDTVVKVADGNPFPVQMRTDAGAAMLGSAAEAASLPVVIASDQDFVKSEDAVHSTGDKGIMALAVRNDGLATTFGADGDYSPIAVNSAGALFIASIESGVVPGTASTSLGKAEDAAHGSGETGVMALAVRSDAGAALAADGDYHALMVNSAGALYVTGGGGGTEYTEDVATANPQVGSAVMMERDDALAAVTPAEGDWIGLRGTARGALWVQHDESVSIPVTDAGGSLTVDSADLATLAGAVSGTEVQVDVVAALPAGTNAIGKLAANTGVDIGDVDVLSSALPSGAATSAAQLAAGHSVVDIPAASGGLTMEKLISAASTNATSVKASAGQVYAVQVFNLNAAAAYLKLYNKASAPTVGTDVPVKVLMIPGDTAGAGMVLNWDKGLEFGTGIAFALTTGIADSDTGAVAADEIAVALDYE